MVTESGDNFLLSCSDLKNLDLMSKNFPEYTGQRRGAHTSAVLDVGEIINEALDDHATTEDGCCITPNNGEEHEQESDSEITVKQDENSIELQYEEELSPDQLLAAEAYSVLFSLGGYTYTNLVEEGVMEAVSTVEEGNEEANYDDVDGDDNAG